MTNTTDFLARLAPAVLALVATAEISSAVAIRVVGRLIVMPAALAKLRDLAPYAVLALVLPGGSVVAFLLWLHRRQRGAPALRG
jgi:hypothetical protein